MTLTKPRRSTRLVNKPPISYIETSIAVPKRKKRTVKPKTKAVAIQAPKKKVAAIQSKKKSDVVDEIRGEDSIAAPCGKGDIFLNWSRYTENTDYGGAAALRRGLALAKREKGSCNGRK